MCPSAFRGRLADENYAFAATPDLEKPLFVARMNFRGIEVARAATAEALADVALLKARVKQLESEKEKRWGTRAKTQASQERSKAKGVKRSKARKKKRKGK